MTQIDPGANELTNGAMQELDMVESILDSNIYRRGSHGSRAIAAQIHFNTARILWLRALPPEKLRPYLPIVLPIIRERLGVIDEGRISIEKIAEKAAEVDSKLTADDLITTVEVVSTAQETAIREEARALNFVRIVRVMTACLSALAIALLLVTSFFPEAVPLCFTPLDPDGTFSIVCPTHDSGPKIKKDNLEEEVRKTADWGDYIVVEIVGLLAAGIAATSALRKIRGTSTAFPVPVALAILKLPTGALTAVLGLVLMRGWFIPGLSALDTPAQIVAWAIIFGYSQELFTKFADRQGQAVLEGVHGPGEHPPQEKRVPRIVHAEEA
ncbi:hypothetical protein [Nonomuraea guangzhouensis]|uniref:Uncharacterized protein n=1 Tax=Nonomuraea guangzhouensis TaxID=1291555 RepID=A0ABW4GNX7_9ACTN|nr:hypothetical protein [Nonomuraea guangzhouensis]